MGELKLKTELVKRGPGTAFVLDDDQVAAVGEGAKRFPVAATINSYTWRSTVVKMRGEFLLGLSRENREAAGAQPGDMVDVTIVLDKAPREVKVPPALAAALATDPEATAAYDRLAYTHRKEYARWIEEAKREETRARRVEQALTMLREGRTRS
jgi:hypothetical protein